MPLAIILIFNVLIALLPTYGESSPYAVRNDFYSPNSITRVQIQMPEKEWKSLRKAEPKGGKCNYEFQGDRYSWFKAEAASINGVEFNDVQLKKKSFCGSYSTSKPSLKLRIGKVESDQARLAQDSFGTKSFTFNNGRQDPYLFIQCFAYDYFRRSGVPAPRCNLAEIRVNDDVIGVYTNVEGIDETFLAEHHRDSTGSLIELEGYDFVHWGLGRLHVESGDVEKTKTIFTNAVSTLQTPTASYDSVSNLVNTKALLPYWAAEILLAHRDGYCSNGNNTYVYASPTDNHRLHFIPYGADKILTPPKMGLDTKAVYESLYTKGAACRKLATYSDQLNELKKELKRQLDSIWVEKDLIESVDLYANQLKELMEPQEYSSIQSSVKKLKEIILKRRSQVEALL